MSRTLTKVVNGTTYEVLLFPMDVLNLSQGVSGYFSHYLVNAIDSCGKDTGKDPVYAPCTMRYKANDTYANGNALFFESVNKVLFADGTIDYATIMMIHADDISGVIDKAKKGETFAQGELLIFEGTAGFCTGNHLHLEVAKGRFSHMYDRHPDSLVWHLPNSISPDLAFFVDGITLYNNGQPPYGLGNPMSWKVCKKPVNASGFSDVELDSYYFGAIKWAREQGFVKGKTDTEFDPKGLISRADTVLILYRLKGEPKPTIENPFSDVRDDAYFKNAVLWASEKGITVGTGSKFRPLDFVSRAEVITFLHRLCGSPKVNVELPFKDIPEGHFATNAIKWGYKLGIVKGKTAEKFDPNAYCTRADTIVMLDRTYHRNKADEIEESDEGSSNESGPSNSEAPKSCDCGCECCSQPSDNSAPETEAPKKEEAKPSPISKLTFPCEGIDISEHNGDFDLTPYANTNQFVILRAGWWINEDLKFRRNVQECERLGIPYGIYWYGYSLDLSQAETEANAFIEALKTCNPTFGAFYDVEWDQWKANNNSEWAKGYPSKEYLYPIVDKVCTLVEKAGYNVGIYAGNGFYDKVPERYPLWWPMYGQDTGYKPEDKGYANICYIWQYSSFGGLDKNWCYAFPKEWSK